MADRRFALELLGVFAAVALLLAAVGIYGVMSYSVTQRSQEIGIRVALGAQRMHIFHMAIGEGMRLVAMGLPIGLIGAGALTRFARTMLFDVSPFDPLTFAAISATLAGVAFVACYAPARRATRVNPLVALREE
jgi:putative ABC transport system permease protein